VCNITAAIASKTKKPVRRSAVPSSSNAHVSVYILCIRHYHLLRHATPCMPIKHAVMEIKKGSAAKKSDVFRGSHGKVHWQSNSRSLAPPSPFPKPKPKPKPKSTGRPPLCFLHMTKWNEVCVCARDGLIVGYRRALVAGPDRRPYSRVVDRDQLLFKGPFSKTLFLHVRAL